MGRQWTLKKKDFSGDEDKYDFIHMELEVLLKLSFEDLQ